MKKNPKIIAGIVGIVIMAGVLIFLLTQIIPLAGEVQQEMKSTPTPLPPVPDTVMADPQPELKEGDWGMDVEEMQKRLLALGYLTGSVDGQFGPMTREAVIAFQNANGLPANGVLDKKTREVLYSQEAVMKQQ